MFHYLYRTSNDFCGNNVLCLSKKLILKFCFSGHAPSCRQIVSAASMKDVEWETWTCVLGFPVIGKDYC